MVASARECRQERGREEGVGRIDVGEQFVDLADSQSWTVGFADSEKPK